MALILLDDLSLGATPTQSMILYMITNKHQYMRDYLYVYSKDMLSKYFLPPSTKYNLECDSLHLYNSLTHVELCICGKHDKLHHLINMLSTGITEDELLSYLVNLEKNYTYDHMILLIQKGVIE